MAGFPLTTEVPCVRRPARSAKASTRSNISRSGRSRGSICRMVCGARASHSVAGVHAALIAAALVATTTSITMATANPRRMCQRCRRSTAGVSSSAGTSPAHGNEDVLGEVEDRPDGQHRKQDDGLAQGGVG